ncbi:hypothetical protein M408DRAFT_175798 [Serendipita vermifera MAFF 305830]|uniref:Uncharacterized protein n=1 Tax=Serendipita vermifera MAFF 305830 TaxID=933852 RepID=A0A0C3B440_SERVB|nr:hypothetical protein M408DRAFT_175798 [Serendipita vermifera MAFF 305830]
MLHRSAYTPLHIFITTTHQDQETCGLKMIKECVLRFLGLLASHSGRCRTLEVDVPEVVANLTRVWIDQAPMLQKLVISTFSYLVTPQQLVVRLFSVHWDKWNCTYINQLYLGPFSKHQPGPNRAELCGILSLLSKQLRSLSILAPWQPGLKDIHYGEPIILEALTSFTTHRWNWAVEQLLLSCSFPVLEDVDVELPLGRLSSHLMLRLRDEPGLLQSVTRLSVDSIVSGETPIEQVQRIFPRANHVKLDYSLDLLHHFASHFLSNWACMDHLDLYEASLPEIREVLMTRYERYPTPLIALKLERAVGPLYKDDYDWIASHVDQFSIRKVRIVSNEVSKDIPFEGIC